MTKTVRFFLAFQITFVVSVINGSSSAAAEVEFLSGGYSEQCAFAAAKEGQVQRLPVTGSNLKLDVIEICTRAIQTWDGSVESIVQSYNNRGVLYFSRGDYGRALADFDAAATRNPSLGQVHLNRGYALSALQRWRESVDALTTGIELGANAESKAYFTRAIGHEELGEIRQAYLDYLQASELDPEWSEPREELARFRVGQ